jgi:hypothetical protein
MKHALLAALTVVLCSVAPSHAFAWGTAGHKLIMQRAIDLLPPELKPLFIANRDEAVMRIVDPDVWRLAGWEDDPNHFVDFGMPELGPYPFNGLPHEYDAALEKFGRDLLTRIGTAPWREAEMFGHLRRAFEAFKRPSPPPYAGSDVIRFSAFAAHYVQDAHQPLHGTNNYDGQMTGQAGLHARFESELIERYAPRLTLNPAAPTGITNARETMFDTLLASYDLVAPLLAADKAALGTKEVYDDEYYEKLFMALKPMLERRLNEAITATAATIIGAWEQAGRPAVMVTMPKQVQKVRK